MLECLNLGRVSSTNFLIKGCFKKKEKMKKQAAIILSFILLCSPLGTGFGEILANNAGAVSRRPSVGGVSGGVPVVNIVAPNAAGVSHNEYSKFDVDAVGAVLNNSRVPSQSELTGGAIARNPRLLGGTAKLILNEIVSPVAAGSLINGAIEVVGEKADVIIANPYGISVNGGKFINAGKALLISGRPEVNAMTGEIEKFQIDGQNGIEISGNGLTAPLTAVELVSRHIKLAGALQAKEVEIKTGNKEYDYASGAASSEERAVDGDTLLYAVSASAFGSVNGDKIKIIATERGLGVRTSDEANLYANAEDVWIESAGAVEINADIKTEGTEEGKKRDITIKGEEIEIKSALRSAQDVKLESSGDITSKGYITAEVASIKSGGTFSNSLEIAAKDIEIEAKGINNTRGWLKSENEIKARAENIQNERGRIEAGGKLTIEASGTALKIEGKYSAQGDAEIKSLGDVINGSNLSGENIIIEAAGDITNQQGKTIKATNEAILTGMNI